MKDAREGVRDSFAASRGGGRLIKHRYRDKEISRGRKDSTPRNPNPNV
jgi:hypothetical protein